MRLAEIRVHPVKSLAGACVQEAEVDDRGLVHDRRYMVVDANGRFITQRERPALALLEARVEPGALVLATRDAEPLRVPPREEAAQARSVRVWDDHVDAVDQGDAAAGWLEARLGSPARLVRMPASTRRPADRRYARPDDLVSFADGFPFLLLGRASLDELNARLERPVDARRFRPNLVVEGSAPFAEDAWTELTIGPMTFHALSGCSRCSVVDVDPDRGERQRDLLAALAAFRKRDGSVWFGVNLVHDVPPGGRAWLRVGDPVTLR